ncbi:MAG: NAD(P)H-dependent oxidoreductase [bacterium]|nr:NAD(P)H-dependent oxidoreductase [Candidatus Minthenecus merdequi]
MKKIVFSIIALVTTLTASAQLSILQGDNMAADTSHVLVAYFSATGTTEKVAQQLASEMGARLWKIEPMDSYTEADLDWRNPDSRSSKEMKDTSERPTIKMCTNIQQYTTIYLGFPIWWGISPRIIQSWIENNFFDGKVIIPFATSGSSPIEPAVEFLRQRYPEITFKNGLLMNDRIAK